MKKINLDINRFLIKSQNSSWQKAVLLSLVVSVICIITAEAYLIIKPVSKEVKSIIDEEISSTNIIFDQKILDSIKERQTPAGSKSPTTGKNPFLGL